MSVRFTAELRVKTQEFFLEEMSEHDRPRDVVINQGELKWRCERREITDLPVVEKEK